jgi:hypothetical protein
MDNIFFFFFIPNPTLNPKLNLEVESYDVYMMCIECVVWDVTRFTHLVTPHGILTGLVHFRTGFRGLMTFVLQFFFIFLTVVNFRGFDDFFFCIRDAYHLDLFRPPPPHAHTHTHTHIRDAYHLDLSPLVNSDLAPLFTWYL